MRIGFDIDGCLANFNANFEELTRSVTGRRNPTPGVYAVWDWPETYLTKDQVAVCFRYVDEHPQWWAGLEPLVEWGTFQDINALPPEHDVYFITSRGPAPGVKFWTEEWLDTHGISFPTVLISEPSEMKGMLAAGLRLDTMIDDKVSNLAAIRKASPKTRCFLLTQPWNVSLEVDPKIIRVGSVDAYIKEVERG